MDHTGNLPFVLSLYRNAVTPVSHGDDGILQIIAGASADQRSKLGVNAVVGDFHAAAHLHKSAAGIVADLILGKNTAADFRGKRRQWLQAGKHAIQGIRQGVAALIPGVCFDTVCVFQKTGDGQKLRDAQSASDFQTL